ncbi:MAG: outer membrane protein assembly factor BamA [Candidatus Omnitrophota bacterium]
MQRHTSRGIFLFLSAALFLTAAVVFAAEEPATGVPQESSATEAARPKTVTAIEVTGNKNISTNTIISKMKTRIGGPYRENIINDDLKRLYLLGFFSDIKINAEDYKEGVKVVINVTERPIIENISFFGISRLTMKEDKIKAQLKSKEGQYLDYPSLGEDVHILQKLYEKTGFSQVDIKYQVDITKETSKAKVRFIINEGKRVRIKNILVEGNNAFPDKRILKVMKTKRAWLFNAGVLKEDVLKEDIERIKSFYRNAGFADVEASYEVKPDAKRPYLLYVIVKINEGKKYLVGNVTIGGNQDISTKDILSRLAFCTTGKVFSQEGLRQDIANIQGLYFDRGYIACQVQEAVSFNADIGRVDIVYNIVENQICYVDKIKIRGNIKTKDLVIRRELRIKPGDKFDGEKLRRSKERLQNLGFFEEINYDVENTPLPDKKDLLVEVKEAKTGAFSFGGGYSSVDELVGFVEVEQKNFDWRNWPYFTGGGQNLKLRASIGSISEGMDISFTEPWLFDYPVSFGFDIYNRNHERDSDSGYGYDEEVTGFDLRLGSEISEYLRQDATYRLDNIDISDINTDATDDLKKEEGSNLISSFTYGLTYDSRDNVFDPTRGNLITGSLECAGGPFGGDKDFWKFFGRVSHYIPFFRGSALELRGRVGIADSYGDSNEIPIYERFFAGGAYTIRGYRERKIGPIDPKSNDPLGGNSMLIGNVEYTYPIFSFLKIAVFFDTGNVWAKTNDIGSGGFKSGTGFGFRIKTPIGPVMLDYGIPFNKEPGEEDKGSGRFYFSMSNTF